MNAVSLFAKKVSVRPRYRRRPHSLPLQHENDPSVAEGKELPRPGQPSSQPKSRKFVRDTLLYNRIAFYTASKHPLPNVDYVILQEKLDGCNLRIVYEHSENGSGRIRFGSRTIALPDDEDFNGYHRIRDDLEKCTRAVATQPELANKSFTIFGELVGYTPRGVPIIPRYNYFEEKEIRFYAYDIFVHSPENIVDGICNGLDRKEGFLIYMDFEKAQNILSVAKFRTIPTKRLDGSCLFEDLCKFESVLFDHDDYFSMEGYVLRFKIHGAVGFLTFKLKPDSLTGFKIKPLSYPKKAGKQTADEVARNESIFSDYASKVPYFDHEGYVQNDSLLSNIVNEYVVETEAAPTDKDFLNFFVPLRERCRQTPNFQKLKREFFAAASSCK